MARTRRRARWAGDTTEHAGDALPPPIDRERIVCVALALLDEVGLDGLNMRRLADRLGITAPTLYWYLRDKEELLGLLADAISGEVSTPDADMPWRARLEALLWEQRCVLLAHRDAARIVSGTIPVGQQRLRRIDVALEALRAAGFEGLDAVRAGRLLGDYVTTFVMEEATEAALTAGAAGQDNGEEGVPTPASSPFAAIPAETYPSIAALAGHLATPDGDGRFRFGLTVLFDGLERQLARRHDGGGLSHTPGPLNRPGRR